MLSIVVVAARLRRMVDWCNCRSKSQRVNQRIRKAICNAKVYGLTPRQLVIDVATALALDGLEVYCVMTRRVSPSFGGALI